MKKIFIFAILLIGCESMKMPQPVPSIVVERSTDSSMCVRFINHFNTDRSVNSVFIHLDKDNFKAYKKELQFLLNQIEDMEKVIISNEDVDPK